MKTPSPRRRQFLKSAAGLAVTAVVTQSSVAAPFIRTSRNRAPRLGQGDYVYEMNHQWAKLPDKYQWQTTHNVAVDPEGMVYVIHEGRENLKDHPSIFVFDPEGTFVRAFGNQFQGGGHGLEVRVEDGTPFLYVSAYQQVKSFAKLDLKGETVWEKHAPMESGKYAEGEASDPKKVWGRDRFMPTNFAFLDDGGFLLADGYGSFYIHRYDRDGQWVSCFGGPGDGEGTFNTPHGLWIDRRPGREPQIVVTDRANDRLQFFDLDGKYLSTMPGFGLPANISTYQSLMLVPELKARVSILDQDNQVVARLGDDTERLNNGSINRTDASTWQDGHFVHPHDACFDNQGNIMVAEWVGTGRVSKLTRV